ncbi:NAD(P)-binding oxidoreductase [Streptomyces sp. DSM 44917]|uniref:NAD(P)-binding oxidoreductase n=1 Tax=Streptomyces boetiae TaxID=3075541 RepID=A0ABU2L2S6_9ACTN|nr:NAD(P)-binding oxidoreductase [Streptomyces sp. DSM 44917]MDT0305875.1 NAD(P)-binding oxidoreductase [Streptomyces sp. DSM 44917]
MSAPTAPILLTGGTGTLGRHVLPLLRDAGHAVRVLSRSPHEARDGVEYVAGDLDSGDGIEEAVAGTEVIVHCAGTPRGDEAKARTLTAAALRAGTRHLVNISVVGADRVPVVGRLDRAMFGYFADKLATERVIADSGVPWTTLRAAQFHDLILDMARPLSRLPLVPHFSGMRFQPIEVSEVAARMAELALAPPAGLVPEMAGPQILTMKAMLRTYLTATGRRRPLLPVRLPGSAARAYREGVNLAPDHAVGHRTWEDFLTERVSAPAR